MAKATYANKIAIIGGGHIGSALAEGLVKSGVPVKNIFVTAPSAPDKLHLKKLRVKTSRDNSVAVKNSDLIFICVKPLQVTAVLDEIKHLLKSKVIVSVAAGINMKTLKMHAPKTQIARIIPNMPIAINQGIVGYFGGNLQQKNQAVLKKLLTRLGLVLEVKSENDLNVQTILPGCGPGIVAYLIAMMTNHSTQLGIKPKNAEQLAQATFSGTLEYLKHYKISPQELVKAVATKGGLTEGIISELTKRKYPKNFDRAMETAYKRIEK